MTIGREKVRDLRLGVDDDGESEVSFLETIGSNMFIQYLRILLPTTLSLASLDLFQIFFLKHFIFPQTSFSQLLLFLWKYFLIPNQNTALH